MLSYLSTNTLRSALVTLQEALTIRAYAKRVAPLERKLEKEAALFFRRQGRAFGPTVDLYFGLRETSEQGDLGALFDSAVADIDLGALAKGIAESYVAGAVAGVADYALGISFDLKNPRAVAYFEARGLELLKELNEKTKVDIAKILQQGLENGASPQALARAIKQQFVEYAIKERGKQSRAEKVAVTEVGRAYQAGNYGAILEASGTGLDFEKSWLAVKNPCPICQANADQGWIAFGAQHSNASQYPPAHPTCRCTELYRRLGS